MKSPVHTLIVFISAWFFLSAPCCGQTPASVGARRFYLIIPDANIRGGVMLRGKTSDTFAHDAIILAPDSDYHEWILDVSTLQVAVAKYHTPSAGQSFQFPEFILKPVSSPDTDGDGVHDLAEFILGTNPRKRDSDGDGIPDGVELRDGTNPLDNLPVTLGIIAATDTGGHAFDVNALNDLAAVANGNAGITVLNVAGQNAIRIAQVGTPTPALRVSLSDNFVAVVLGAYGLGIVDITDPPAARIVHQVGLGSPSRAVVTAAGFAYVGLANGDVVVVDLASGFILTRRSLGSVVNDLVLAGDHLVVAAGNSLVLLDPFRLDLPIVGNWAIAAAQRIVAGNGLIYATVSNGFDVYALSEDSTLQLLSQTRPGQTDWRDFVVNGSGLGLAAVNLARAGTPLDVELYNIPNSNQSGQLVTRIETPGDSEAISIYNGRAYVADGESGLQIINYLPYDRGTNPPSISLSTSFTLNSPTNGIAEEGKLVRLSAAVSDDVQVRNVEFFVDGLRVLTDGNFPFEHRFISPRLSSGKTNFTVRAKAFDTGGNFSWSDTILVDLTPDATPPIVLGTTPGAMAVISVTNGTTAAFAHFSEPLDVRSLGLGNVRMISAGPDGLWETSDDAVMTNVNVTYRESLNTAVLETFSEFPLGLYQCVVSTNVTDAVGNHLASEYRWKFAVVSGGPDDDDDGDGLTNAQEIAFGSNPFAADSDGDGWSDLDEFENNTDPAVTNSQPSVTVFASPPVALDVPSPASLGLSGSPIAVTQPRVSIEVASLESFGAAGNSIFIAHPLVSIETPSPDAVGATGITTIMAYPPLQLDVPGPDSFGVSGLELFLAMPPISIEVSNQQTGQTP